MASIRTKCAFWDKCYRKNKNHVRDFIHPGDKDEKDVSKDDNDVEMKDLSGAGDSNKRKVHEISDDEDEVMGSSKTKKQKTDSPETSSATASTSSTTASTSSAETSTSSTDKPVIKFKSRKEKCKYWLKCFRKEQKHLLEFYHPGDDITDEVEANVDKKTRGKAKEVLNDLMDGQIVEFDSGFKLKRMGDNYSCSCSSWVSSSDPIAERTCKHLMEYNGEDFEKSRVAVSKPKKTVIRSHINVSLLLAHKYDEKANDPTGWWMSEKLDGVRAFWNGNCFYSRLGNCFIAPQWFTKDLPKDLHLDGELFGGRGKFQSTVKIVKNQECDDWKKVKYHVFDSPNQGKEPFEKRYDTLREFFDANSPQYAVLCEQTKCKGKEHIQEEMKKILKLHGEGLMIRQPKSQYESSRSKTLLKIKKFHDAEARVIGYKQGTGRFHNAVGALLVEMANGKQFHVGSGLTDADRRKPPKKGTIITYKFQEYTNSGTPRFPSYIGIRIDMTEPNDVILPPKPTDD